MELSLDSFSDPPLTSDYLTKRVTQIMTSVNLETDQSLRDSIQHLNLDEDYLHRTLISKAK